MSLSVNFPTIRPSLALDFAATRSLDPRITFTRASTATYYDDHTVAKAEENLLLESQAFSGWSGNNATVTGAQAGPDGSTNAVLLTSTNTSVSLFSAATPTVTTNLFTASFYAKAGTAPFVYLREFLTNGSQQRTWFNVSTGAVGTTSGVHTASIVNVGSGWYRCIITFTPNATRSQAFQLGISDADGSDAVTVGRTATFFGAQLEQRSSVTAYTPTTTQTITNYVPQLLTAASGVARFEHNPVTRESLGLEIEESRTNLVLRSEDFSLWSQVNGSAQSNVIVAPDGTLTADKFVANTVFGQHRVEQTFSLTSGTAYTISVYAKAAECSAIQLRTANDAANADFSLSTGTVLTLYNGSNATITPVGNGWYRCSVTGTATATGSAINARINVYSPANAQTWTGNDRDGLYLWGAQVEAGAFPTSYIPTVASQVTRSADAASMTGTNFSSWYRADEGTLYAEAISNGFVINQMIASITNGTLTNPVQVYQDAVSQLQTNAWGNGTVTNTITVGTNFKFAYGLALNNLASSVNGGAVSTDLSVGPASTTYSQMNIGNRNGLLFWNGTIKKLAYYPQRLTNAQLQALTTV